MPFIKIGQVDVNEEQINISNSLSFFFIAFYAYWLNVSSYFCLPSLLIVSFARALLYLLLPSMFVSVYISFSSLLVSTSSHSFDISSRWSLWTKAYGCCVSVAGSILTDGTILDGSKGSNHLSVTPRLFCLQKTYQIGCLDSGLSSKSHLYVSSL